MTKTVGESEGRSPDQRALFWLFDENPQLGEQWLSIVSDKDGREFDRRTQGRLLEIMPSTNSSMRTRRDRRRRYTFDSLAL